MKLTRLQHLLNFLQKSPHDSFTLYSIAYEYLLISDFTKALAYFEQLKQTDPNYAGTYYHLGKTLEALNRKEEAIAVYKEGIALTQKSRDYHALSELQTALHRVLGLDYEDEV